MLNVRYCRFGVAAVLLAGLTAACTNPVGSEAKHERTYSAQSQALADTASQVELGAGTVTSDTTGRGGGFIGSGH